MGLPGSAVGTFTLRASPGWVAGLLPVFHYYKQHTENHLCNHDFLLCSDDGCTGKFLKTVLVVRFGVYMF